MAEATQTLGSQLLGSSRGIVAVRERVQQLLRQSAGHRLPPILICGETGTGKGLLARMIHGLGPRHDGPFVDVNCAAIPETLLEAELFGFERGAFTDARRAKPGLFQTAHHGTIFLDEVGLLPETLQAKLLKVIEERVVRRLGSTQGEPVDVAILAATNEDLLSAVRMRKFREDLYHRLAVLTVELPPLRERRDDIVPLAEHFLAQTSAEYGLAQRSLAPEARAVLSGYAWPGNVRELANVIERASLLAEGPVLTAAMLQLGEAAGARAPGAAGGPGDVLAKSTVADLEERVILQALAETSWNFSKTAARLGVSRNTLKARIKKYGLQPGGAAAAGVEAPAAKPAPALPSPAPAPPGRAGVQWDSRRLALLRVVPATPEDEPPAAEFSRALDLLIQKVETFGGRVVEIGVSALVAAFGLEPVEDAPRRAALAALAVQKAALRGGGQVERLPMKAAIHAALVPVARVGTAASIDGDARREVWSVLDVLIAASEPGAIVLSRPAMALLARWFDIADTGTSEARGAPVYRLMGYRATPFDVGGYMGRFVGRESELDLLRARFEAVRAGQGQVVALVGDAGIGKSRLLFEFRQSLADQSLTHLQGHCLSYGSAIPYLPVLEVVRAVCRLTESDTAEAIADKVRARLAGVGLDPEQGAPYLLRLLGIEDGTDAVARLSPEVIKGRTFETLHALFLKSSQREPLLAAVEDLHWIDPTSEEYLASLAERVAGERMLLVATYRPGYRPPWIEKSSVTRIALQPLAPEHGLTVVRVVLGTHEVDDALAQLILAKAEGNPFFLEELARATRDQGPASTTLTAPDTVREVLLARIDRLPPDARRLLQSAAVIGKDFSFEILRAIADGSAETVRAALRHLQSAEFVYETSPVPQSEYTFKHALTHEVAYESLQDGDRKRLHGRVLVAMEELWPHARAEHAEALANHTLRAEIWDKAVDYLRLAGAKAWNRGALAEAIGRYEEALAIVRRVPPSDDMARRSIDVRLDLHAPLMTVGRTHEVAELYPEAERLARELKDGPRLGQVLQRMSQVAWLGAQYRRGAECAQHALAVGETSHDAATRMRAHYFLGLHRHALGDYRGAIPCFARLVEGPDAPLASRVISVTVPMDVPASCWLAFAHAMTGDFARAEESLRRAVATAETSDFPQARVIARTMEAIVLTFAGRADACLETLPRTLELCERIGFFVWLAAASSTLGLVLTRVGRPGEALPHLERGVAINEKTGVRTYQAQRHAWWAEGLLRAGDVEGARTHAEASVELARALEERGVEAEALLVRARVARAHAPDRGARDWFERALTASAETGARPFEGHCHLGLGELLDRMGDTAEARRHRETAHAMFREMRLRPWWPER